MWTPERDAELRRLGTETYIARHPGADAQEVQDRYLLLLDPEGRAALLRERNRLVEEGKWTQPIARKRAPDPWPPEVVEKLRELHEEGLAAAEIARKLRKTESAVVAKTFRLFRKSAKANTTPGSGK